MVLQVCAERKLRECVLSTGLPASSGVLQEYIGMQSCGRLKTAVITVLDGILTVTRLECIGTLLHAICGIVVRAFGELCMLSW